MNNQISNEEIKPEQATNHDQTRWPVDCRTTNTDQQETETTDQERSALEKPKLDGLLLHSERNPLPE
jgi:hypothetical protein